MKLKLALFTVGLLFVLPGAVAEAQTAQPDPDERLVQLLDYRTRHLSVRGTEVLSGGATYVVHRRYGWGWNPYWGWGTTYVIQEPITSEHIWAVYQGQQRLSVPVYLSVVGQQAAHEELVTRIRNHRNAGFALLAVGGTGFVAMMTGLAGMNFADRAPQYYGWGIMAGSGLISMLVGLIAGSSNLSFANHLRWDFTSTMDPRDCREAVREYNRSLRTELGLTEAEASSVTRQGARR